MPRVPSALRHPPLVFGHPSDSLRPLLIFDHFQIAFNLFPIQPPLVRQDFYQNETVAQKSVNGDQKEVFYLRAFGCGQHYCQINTGKGSLNGNVRDF